MLLSCSKRGTSILHISSRPIRCFHACAFGGSGTGVNIKRRRDSMPSSKKFVGRPSVRSESSSSSNSNNPKASATAPTAAGPSPAAAAASNVSRAAGHASPSTGSSGVSGSTTAAAATTGRAESSSTSSPSPSSTSTASLSPADIAKQFPYSRLTDSQFHQMSQELNNDLPLQAFFAGHRPLMLMDPNIGTKSVEDDASKDFDWMTLPAASPVEEAERVFLPLKIIGGIGPFDSRKLSSLSPLSSASAEAAGENNNNANNKLIGYGYYNWKEDDSDTTIIFAKTSGNGSNIKDVVTLLNDQVEEDHESGMAADSEGIEATSVKRKRRLKMNRHKLKKRRKSQRALKRRLGH